MVDSEFEEGWAKTPGIRRSNGFALVVTVSLMVLLAILGVGMLALSSVSLRSSTRAMAMAEARANARLAVMIAIGRLQSELGPDQRISAKASILEESATVANPHWTGVWDSWIAGPLPDARNPDYPSAASHHRTIGDQPDASMRPQYDDKNDHFRSWLVSLSPAGAENPSAISTGLAANLYPGKDDGAVALVEEGSLGTGADSSNFVTVPLVPSQGKDGSVSGRYAWWVGDESQKARLMTDPDESGSSLLTTAEKVFRQQAPASMGNRDVPGLEGMTDETQLNRLASLRSLDLLAVSPPPSEADPSVSESNFHHVTPYSAGLLADVREGGLKRDLSTLLERPILLEEDGDEFMLYQFDEEGEDRVPIQDLAAYYQLYDNDPNRSAGRRGGVRHNAGSAGVMQVDVPDYGDKNNRDRFLREYTALYRNPVPIKVQFVLGVGAKEFTRTERDFAISKGHPVRDSDKYKLLLGVKPVVSLWNPNNVPMVMGTDASQFMKVSFPPFVLRWKKYRSGGEEFTSEYLNLNYAISNESTNDGRARSLGPYIMTLQFARDNPIIFEPGEVKMFSIPINAANFLESGGVSTFGNSPVYQAVEFLPDGFYVTAKSAVRRWADVPWLGPNLYRDIFLVFGDGDRLDMEVVPEAQSPRSSAVSNANEIVGSAFHFWMSGAGCTNQNGPTSHFRNYQFISRFGGTEDPRKNPNFQFNSELMLAGFPDGQPIPFEGETNSLSGAEILAATAAGEAKALLNFFMMAGCEAHESVSGGEGAGRRITTRPFLHGSVLSAPQISRNSRADLYDYAWEWQVNKINELEEAFHDDGNGRGFFGGGYTSENGVTHVVQQYLPVLPPISIASLSNARLGGFSLANAPVMSTGDVDVRVGGPYDTGNIIRDAPNAGDFRQVTATGQGGLAPHVLQAIGNSYAHPNLPVDKAFTTKVQLLNTDTDYADPPERAYADHSYLANKALWDEFFFSSIAPQPADIPLYGSASDKTAVALAKEFLFNEGVLPNRRFIPYTSQLSEEDFDELELQYSDYEDGFADKIATHLMVQGPFNINSTSEEAWKVLFSSLKGKSLTYLVDQASSLSTTTPEGTHAAQGLPANGEPILASDLGTDPNAPPEQWTTSRSLTDEEIEELAAAMVKQVKKRGPFLSLSEFINRRLDGGNEELALKGALQAALDDEDVSINAAFRTDARSADNELDGMTAEFSGALEGPIAYGSTPYVDQADLLRHMGSILTPRGDTFLIRTYGDSLDSAGNVTARAWCEAVVQRTVDYVDQADEPHLKAAEISGANRQFGRKFQIISFRWLGANEV